jgi:nucleoside-diphosphate-sugar epimerase
LKILLTGSSGFLGKFIYRELSMNNVVHTLNRFYSTYNIDLSFDKPILFETYELVIHAAGKAHVIPKSDAEKTEFYDVNVKGTSNLLESLTLQGMPKFFVYISSVSVYGLKYGNLIDENTPLLADDSYGESKILAEELIRDWCNNNNVILTILRLPLVVGSNPPGNLGAMIRGIKKGIYFNIAGGNARKSMVLASDISKCILKAAETGGVYNLTDGHHPSFYELSTIISKQIGKSFVPNLPKSLAFILAKFGDHLGNKFPINSLKLLKINSSLTFDDSKARLMFNWNPSKVLESFKLNENA